jgi:hypothetical protein
LLSTIQLNREQLPEVVIFQSRFAMQYFNWLLII